MAARDNLADLAHFLAGDPDLEIATVAKAATTGAPEIRSLSVADDAREFFADVIAKRVGRQLSPLAWTLRRLDPTYKPDDAQIEWDETADVDPVADAVRSLSNLSVAVPFAGSDEAYKKRLSYWAAVYSDDDGGKAYFFRSFTSAAELKRKRGAALVSRDGTFSKVEESIFLFDDIIDCFVFRDYVYIIRKRDYRRIFDQVAAVLKRAKKAAKELHRKLPIDNFGEFEQACSTDSRLADKVLAVRQRSYFDTLSYAMVKPVIAEFKLDIPTKQVGGETRLVFKTEPDQRFRILKLVDDDYLRSSMTNTKYEVNSKTGPPGP